jgi:DnaJ family protein A protein 2
MQKDDYYKLFEIKEDASQDEIKKAYRKLSLKWHPDKNPNNPEAVNNFQKISEVYETLSCPEKREEYDMMRKNPFFNGFRSGNSNDFSEVDELFSMFFGGFPMNNSSSPYPTMNRSRMQHGMQHDMQHGMPNGLSGLFPGMHGSGSGSNIRFFRNGVQINPMMEKPCPIVKNVEISMEQVLSGGKIPIEIDRWVIENGNKVYENVTIYFEIFKGIDNNEIIVLKDQGNVMNEMCKGDIKIFIKVLNHARFERKGLDLVYFHNISLKESLCGFSFELKHLNGKLYTINNKCGNIITPNYEKIIPNMGLNREDHCGSLIVHFNIEFPETLTSQQLEILSKTL